MKHSQTGKKTYRVDSEDNLVYKKEMALKGSWSLTADHNLAYIFQHKDDSKSGTTTVITGTLKDVKSNELTFKVDTKNPVNKDWENTITLKGAWQADKYNRLIFNVQKENSEHDILTFKNTWRINKRHNIIYSYKNASLLTKKTKTQTLTFKGYWNIKDKRRVYYEFENGSNSGFEFLFGGAKLKKNAIKFKLLVGARPQKNTILLKGQWRLNPTLGLSFEMEHEDNKLHTALKADIHLEGKNKFSLKLLQKGFGVRFTKQLLKNLSTFVDYEQDKESYEAKVGFGIKF